MNDRMIELFEIAGISDSINEEFGIEYLANLIIKDCIAAAELVCLGDESGEHGFTVSCVVANIKNLFGVKT